MRSIEGWKDVGIIRIQTSTFKPRFGSDAKVKSDMNYEFLENGVKLLIIFNTIFCLL